MNNRWMKIRTLICAGVAIGWWGLWYPEFAKSAGVYTVVAENEAVQDPEEVVECELDGFTYKELFQMDSSQLRFRSRLWQIAEEYLEKVRF